MRLLLGGNVHNLGSKAIAILETIRHDITQIPRTERAQAAYTHRTGGRTIGVEIRDREEVTIADADAAFAEAPLAAGGGEPGGRPALVEEQHDAGLTVRDQDIRAAVAIGVDPAGALGIAPGEGRQQRRIVAKGAI